MQKDRRDQSFFRSSSSWVGKQGRQELGFIPLGSSSHPRPDHTPKVGINIFLHAEEQIKVQECHTTHPKSHVT